MAHTRRRRRNAYRALRGETPSTVAVLTTETDFAAMRGYSSFTFDDYAAYLRHVHELLNSLAAQGVHTRVAHFDPARYATYCAEDSLDPDAAASRTLYNAEVAGSGITLPYRGQSCDELLPLLRAHRTREAAWEESSRLLAVADRGKDPSRGTGGEALDTAACAVDALLAVLEPGTHHLVCSVDGPATPLLAVLHADTARSRPPELDESEVLLLCAVLAAGLVTRSPGGLVTRTTGPSGGSGSRGPEVVRGWCLQRGWLAPLTAGQVFAAYCTHAETGEPLPPEHGVEYSAGIPLPRPERSGR